MNEWKVCFLFIFLPQSLALREDTVAVDIDVHQLERLVELLTSKECEDLLFALSHPEENIFQHLDRLSPEKNQLDLKVRFKRDASSAADLTVVPGPPRERTLWYHQSAYGIRQAALSVKGNGETQCRTALTDWLLKYGERTYYDKLSRALQHIGRTDIAVEVGKNINQDKALSLKRYVEDYHKFVKSLNIPSVKADTKPHQHAHQRVRTKKVRDLTWSDLDLIVERAPIPVYPRGPLEMALPFLCGILLGFGGTLLAGVSLLFIIYISQRRPTRQL